MPMQCMPPFCAKSPSPFLGVTFWPAHRLAPVRRWLFLFRFSIVSGNRNRESDFVRFCFLPLENSQSKRKSVEICHSCFNFQRFDGSKINALVLLHHQVSGVPSPSRWTQNEGVYGGLATRKGRREICSQKIPRCCEMLCGLVYFRPAISVSCHPFVQPLLRHP